MPINKKPKANNPKGNNQYDNIYSDKPIQANLLFEDDLKIRRIAAAKPRGWLSKFVREAVSKALKEIEDEAILNIK